MKSLTCIQYLFVKVLSFLLFCNMTLLANTLYAEADNNAHTTASSTLESNTKVVTEMAEVSLDSFTNMGIVIMIILSSLLGAFFLKDELSDAFKA